MDDFLSENEKWELVKKWLRENGPFMVGAVALVAAGLWGWNWWKSQKESDTLVASGQYHQAMEAFGKGDKARGIAIIDEIKKDHAHSPYGDQGDLALARVHVEANELDKAAERLRGVMEHSDDHELSLVARLRLARVQIAQKKPDDALATLNPATAGAFAPRFNEVRGDAYVAKGDTKAALAEYLKARGVGPSTVVDNELLDLKIQDLEAAEAAPAKKTPATASTVE